MPEYKTISCKKHDTTKHENNRNNGTVCLRNPNLKLLDNDILYHLGLQTKTNDLVKLFGDVKFVCMGGSAKRMEHFARYVHSKLADVLPTGTEFQELEYSYRYPMYKVGPILSICHGIGISSLQILLLELFKLLYYAKVNDPVLIRIGTSGGVGVDPGSIVISNGAVDDMINPYFEQAAAGKKIRRPTVLDEALALEIKDLHENEDGFELVLGKTMCALDFYEGQGRLDGAFCEFTESDKMDFMNKLYKAGVRNIEMESTVFAALTHHANIRAAIICVTFLNRLEGDQVCPSSEVLKEWELRPQLIVSRYIRKYLQDQK